MWLLKFPTIGPTVCNFKWLYSIFVTARPVDDHSKEFPDVYAYYQFQVSSLESGKMGETRERARARAREIRLPRGGTVKRGNLANTREDCEELVV